MNKLYTLFIVVILSSCAGATMYNPDYVPFTSPMPESQKFDGKVLIQMDSADEVEVLSIRPSSLTGGATTSQFDIGRITKEIALSVFEKHFSEGADFSNMLSDGYRMTISPKVKSMEYKFDQLSNAGFAITPRVEVELQVITYDQNGNISYSKTYSSGDYAGKTYGGSLNPSDEINKTLHRALHELMTNAVRDTKVIR